MFVLSSHPMNSRFLHAYCFIFYVVLLYLTWFVLDIVIRRSSNTCVNSSNKYTSIKIYTNCSQLYIFQNGLRTYNREYIYIKHKLNTFLKDKKLDIKFNQRSIIIYYFQSCNFYIDKNIFLLLLFDYLKAKYFKMVSGYYCHKR